MSIARTSDGFLWVVLLIVAIFILFPLLMMVFALPMMGMMGWWGDGMMGGGFSPLWGVGMMLVWLLVLVGISYFLFRGLIGHVETNRARDPALEELRMAYARGDLSEDEYEERRQRLQRDG